MKQILYNSLEHVCYHEAGHILAAACIGALVEAAVVKEYGANDFSGRTSARFSEHAQGMLLACGGLASEYFLYKAGMLLAPNGERFSLDDFRKAALYSARDDFETFLERASAGTPADRQFANLAGFIKFAEMLDGQFKLEALEQFAQILIDKRSMDAATFGKIVSANNL